jgi:hypothetical protein
MQLSGALGCGRWTGALLLPRGKQASEPILTTRPLRTRDECARPGSSHTSFAKAKQASDEFAAVQSLVVHGRHQIDIGPSAASA